jgi:hypothetical protein
MFWIVIAISVGIIFLLTWIGAAMTRRGIPTRWERDGRFIPGDDDHHWH